MIVYFGIVHKSSCLLIYLLREMRREKIIEMMERDLRGLCISNRSCFRGNNIEHNIYYLLSNYQQLNRFSLV